MSFDISIQKTLDECAIDVCFQSSAKLAALVGKSGTGKTTLLNCVAGIVEPDAGHISVGGEKLFDSAKGLSLKPDTRGCGYVFQDSRLFPHKSVSANLAYGQSRSGGSSEGISFDDVVALLDIAHLLGRSPINLSGGETRRVAIGRALLSGPRFLLLDEPLASLDGERAGQILLTIERLRDELAIPMLYVSHDEAEVARLTDTIITLD